MWSCPTRPGTARHRRAWRTPPRTEHGPGCRRRGSASAQQCPVRGRRKRQAGVLPGLSGPRGPFSCSAISALSCCHRRAIAPSVCFIEAAIVVNGPGRRPAHLAMSAILVNGSRSWRICGGAFTSTCVRLTIAEVRALTATSLATLSWRIISTVPSWVLGDSGGLAGQHGHARRSRRRWCRTCRGGDGHGGRFG